MGEPPVRIGSHWRNRLSRKVSTVVAEWDVNAPCQRVCIVSASGRTERWIDAELLRETYVEIPSGGEA